MSYLWALVAPYLDARELIALAETNRSTREVITDLHIWNTYCVKLYGRLLAHPYSAVAHHLKSPPTLKFKGESLQLDDEKLESAYKFARLGPYLAIETLEGKLYLSDGHFVMLRDDNIKTLTSDGKRIFYTSKRDSHYRAIQYFPSYLLTAISPNEILHKGSSTLSTESVELNSAGIELGDAPKLGEITQTIPSTEQPGHLISDVVCLGSKTPIYVWIDDGVAYYKHGKHNFIEPDFKRGITCRLISPIRLNSKFDLPYCRIIISSELSCLLMSEDGHLVELVFLESETMTRRFAFEHVVLAECKQHVYSTSIKAFTESGECWSWSLNWGTDRVLGEPERSDARLGAVRLWVPYQMPHHPSQ